MIVMTSQGKPRARVLGALISCALMLGISVPGMIPIAGAEEAPAISELFTQQDVHLSDDGKSVTLKEGHWGLSDDAANIEVFDVDGSRLAELPLLGYLNDGVHKLVADITSGAKTLTLGDGGRAEESKQEEFNRALQQRKAEIDETQGVAEAFNTLSNHYTSYAQIALHEDPARFIGAATAGAVAGYFAGFVVYSAIFTLPMFAGTAISSVMTVITAPLALTIVGAVVPLSFIVLAFAIPSVYFFTGLIADGASIGYNAWWVSVTAGQLSPNRHVRESANTVADDFNQLYRAIQRSVGLPDSGFAPLPSPPFTYDLNPHL